MTTDATPGALGSNDPLGLPAEAALSVHDLALRFDTSAAWLLNGMRPAGPLVGAGAYLEAATRLRQQADEIWRLRTGAQYALAALLAVNMDSSTRSELSVAAAEHLRNVLRA